MDTLMAAWCALLRSMGLGAWLETNYPGACPPNLTEEEKWERACMRMGDDSGG